MLDPSQHHLKLKINHTDILAATLPSVYNHQFSVMHTRGSYSLTFTNKDNSLSLSGTNSQTNNFTYFSQGHIIKQSPSSLGVAILIQWPKNNCTKSHFKYLKYSDFFFKVLEKSRVRKQNIQQCAILHVQEVLSGKITSETRCEEMMEGLPWWSRGEDSKFPTEGHSLIDLWWGN